MLVEDCPAVLRTYHKRRDSKKGKDPLLTKFMKNNFPSLEAEALPLRLDGELSDSDDSQNIGDDAEGMVTDDIPNGIMDSDGGNASATRDDGGGATPARSHRYPTRASRAR